MVPATAHLNRYTGNIVMPEGVEEIGYIYAAHLSQPGDPIHYEAAYTEGTKPLSHYPVNVYRLRISASNFLTQGITRVGVNLEMGRIVPRPGDEHNAVAANVHVGRIIDDLRRAGLDPEWVYNQSIWDDPGTGTTAELRHDLWSRPRCAVLKIGVLDSTDQRARLTERARRHAWYCEVTGAVPVYTIDLNAAPSLDAFRRKLDAMKTLHEKHGGEFNAWADGGEDRTPFSEIEERLGLYAEAVRGG